VYLDPEKLKASGLSDLVTPRKPYAVINLAGMEGTGKTHWGLTAPKPLLYQSTDFGEEGVLQKASGQIIRPLKGGYKIDIPFELRAFVDRQETTEARQKREGLLANFIHEQFYVPFLKDFQAGIAAGVKSVVWDSALDVWEYTRLSVYGRSATNRDDLKTEANTKYREMVRLANVHEVNLIMINHLKPKWEQYFDARGEPKWRQGRDFEMQGFDKAPFLVTCNLWTSFAAPDQWNLAVKKCRDNPSLVGQTVPALPFVELMSLLVPGVAAEEWEK